MVSGRECVRALERAGFYLKRQEGSHMILRRDNPFAQVVVRSSSPITENWTGAHEAYPELTREDVVLWGPSTTLAR